MEPITKVTIESNYGGTTTHKYFHSVTQAKRWCEKQNGGDIEWENVANANPYVWWSPELEIDDIDMTFYLEPITIEVMDDNDGEV